MAYKNKIMKNESEKPEVAKAIQEKRNELILMIRGEQDNKQQSRLLQGNKRQFRKP